MTRFSDFSETCHDCAVAVGELHEIGCCDVEECPFCHRQLISCGCFEKHITLNSKQMALRKAGKEYRLTKRQVDEWVKILNTNGRIPYGKERRRKTRLLGS
jgi:hypothetical protein